MIDKLVWFVQAQAWSLFSGIKQEFLSNTGSKAIVTVAIPPIKLPDRSSVLSFSFTYPEVPVGPLRVPRAFGSEGELQGKLMDRIKQSCQETQSAAVLSLTADSSEIGKEAWNNLYKWVVSCPKPIDGGDVTDVLIARGAGDTPIAICEHFTNLVLAAPYIQRYASIEEILRFSEWVSRFAYYVRDYNPAQLNNHLVWKALFCLTAGNYLGDNTLFRDGVRYFRKAITQIRHDGSLPLELARGHLASSYTRMWVEGMLQCVRVLNAQGMYEFRDMEILRKTVFNFYFCATANKAWCEKYTSFINSSKEQRLPEDLASWDWVFSLSSSVFSGYDMPVPERSVKRVWFDDLKDAYVTMFLQS